MFARTRTYPGPASSSKSIPSPIRVYPQCVFDQVLNGTWPISPVWPSRYVEEATRAFIEAWERGSLEDPIMTQTMLTKVPEQHRAKVWEQSAARERRRCSACSACSATFGVAQVRSLFNSHLHKVGPVGPVGM